jgi:hypothetical protein
VRSCSSASPRVASSASSSAPMGRAGRSCTCPPEVRGLRRRRRRSPSTGTTCR